MAWHPIGNPHIKEVTPKPRAIAVVPEVEILTIGPFIPLWSSFGCDMFKVDDKGYGEWLNAKPEWLVVYVSLHRYSVLKLEKLVTGMEAIRQPYLWVVRKDN
ncbi:hypothetical protein ZIOFF_042539 [Zingiber officinale]|uniref:Uncharacterized protein n=1 Tax=Zingiber officinale TaxID=94328 RepID=A0A8J5FTF2_ZINOF|nr:hypothetical protein ZIOFF_042539 [Zingiber officinale]